MATSDEVAMIIEHKQRENGISRVERVAVNFGNGLRGTHRVEGDLTRRLGMTLNQFALFVAVAKYSSVTKASAELRVSQPSISQQLRQLEASYGAKLYRRLSKGIEITAAGQVFLRSITPILALVAKLGDGCKPSSSQKLVPEVFTVGGTFSASAVLLPTLLARLQMRYPKAELEFRTSTSEHLERLVRNSAVDMAVTDREAPSNELSSDLLRREKVVAFVLAGHSLARRKIVRLADLLAETLIIRGGKGISGTTESALKRLHDQGMEVNVGMRCDGPAAIKAAVRQKMGVGIAFEDSVRAEIDSGEFKMLKVRDLKLEAKSFIVYPKKRPLSPLAQEFLELLRDARTKRRKFDSAPADKRWSIRITADPLIERRVAV
jgi:DNA-binding transcriptional LysR family regulator